MPCSFPLSLGSKVWRFWLFWLINGLQSSDRHPDKPYLAALILVLSTLGVQSVLSSCRLKLQMIQAH